MERTSQRSLPATLFVIALALVALRIASHYVEWPSKKGDGSGVQWISLDQLANVTSDKPILIDFTAEWCAPCHVLDREVFQNPDVARKINERFIAVRVVDRKREEGRNAPDVDMLQQRFSVRAFPTVVFADAGGNELARMEGFRGRAEFVRVMERVR